jgi:hypothetical protein
MLIYDLGLSDLTKLLNEWNEPAYRAKQIWQGLYQHFYDSAEQFTNLPKSLREKLDPLFISPIKPKLYLDSSDGQTRKTLFELNDGQVIEAVLIHWTRAENALYLDAGGLCDGLRVLRNRSNGIQTTSFQRRDHRAGDVLCPDVETGE